MELLPSSRRKPLRDWERNLCKKADELSILCGTDVCMIIFKPQKTKPETWPRDCTQVHHIIKKYKAMAMKNNDIKGTRSPSSLGAVRDATDATTAHSTCSHVTNNKMKLDLNISDSYDSELIGDDEAELATLEAMLQAIAKRIALREATHI
ncbi:MADS-box transcription factor 22-like [Rosa chinensis]|uniref:MADS-box transcription factor 22-like n=1 Tax=Rosa chinensis TaxID=74649 RepID=UPI000D096D80|nr:MADS-box transcription factor 22-like [Rosa chinensis]